MGTDRTKPFGKPTLLTNLSTGSDERGPSLASDGTTLYFHRSVNGYDVFSSTRGSISDVSATSFAVGQTVAGVDSHTYRASSSNNFATPSPVTELQTTIGEYSPLPTADDLGLFYSKLVGNGMPSEIWYAHRKATNLQYDTFSVVAELNDPNQRTEASWLSPDGCRIYVTSIRAAGIGQNDLYFAEHPK